MYTNNIPAQKIGYLTLATASLLLIPLIAMQFSDEIFWSVSDFVIAGILLFGTGIAYILIALKSGDLAYRIGIGLALFTGLFLIGANLAVGIIGAEDHPINLWYFGVIAVGIIGALLSRLQPQGMAFTMLAMICSHVLIVVLALLKGMHHQPLNSIVEILGINGFFVILFSISGLFLKRASDESLRDHGDGIDTASLNHSESQ